MIVRVFQVEAEDGQQGRFEEFFREEALPLVARQPGLVSVTAGTPLPETPRDFCMVMVWRDVDSLRAFAGEDWRQPHIHPDEARLVSSRRLSHYRLVDG